MLDSMARFYNSQITGHVGYFLTSVVGYFAVWSVAVFPWMSRWIPQQDVALWSAILAVVVFAIYFVVPLPPSPTYFLARIQYYSALSGVVWDHMGLNSSKKDVFYALKHRAYPTADNDGSSDRLGVTRAVTELFEARLYLSLPKRDGPQKRWKRDFHFEHYLKACPKTGLQPEYEMRGSIGVWKFRYPMTYLLRIAYNGAISGMIQDEKRKKKRGKGALFKECPGVLQLARLFLVGGVKETYRSWWQRVRKRTMALRARRPHS